MKDHYHITGTEYRGAAHNEIMQLKAYVECKTSAVPVVFHNLEDYDRHL